MPEPTTLTPAQLKAVELLYDPRTLTDAQLDVVLDEAEGDQLGVMERPDRFEPQ